MAQRSQFRENLKATREAGKAGRDAAREFLEKNRFPFTITVLGVVGIILAVRSLLLHDTVGALLDVAVFFVVGLVAFWVHKMGWDKPSKKSG